MKETLLKLWVDNHPNEFQEIQRLLESYIHYNPQNNLTSLEIENNAELLEKCCKIFFGTSTWDLLEFYTGSGDLVDYVEEILLDLRDTINSK